MKGKKLLSHLLKPLEDFRDFMVREEDERWEHACLIYICIVFILIKGMCMNFLYICFMYTHTHTHKRMHRVL